MKTFKYSFVLIGVMMLVSCGSTKDVAYLQNSDAIDFTKSRYLYDARIMPKDILTITVSTVNPEAATPFNLTIPTVFNTDRRALIHSLQCRPI